jgi:hypothetical protein
MHRNIQTETNQTGGGDMMSYSIKKINQKTLKKNSAIDRHFVVKFNDDFGDRRPRIRDISQQLQNMVGDIIRDTTGDLNPSDLIRF